MAELVTLQEVCDFLVATPDDDTLRDLVDSVEATFNAACGRGDAPFTLGTANVVERHDGTGSCRLWTRYPIKTLTSITLGYDSSAPEESIAGNDRSKVIWEEGSRRVTRIDGRVFGVLGRPGYVKVTYDSADDLPGDAKLAILRAVATIYGQRGSEDAQQESIGGQAVINAKALEADPVWRDAVARHQVWV